ncbi:hypothetical protein JXB37_05715 [candidate division WOR-3 bacterium]|nr:hypothetical protein [candidate division WOR-3 bacterium]
MKDLELDPGLAELLERVRREEVRLRCHGVGYEETWRAVEPELRPVLDRFGVGVTAHANYRSFCREVVKACRRRQGADLKLGIELSIRKWRDFGLDLGNLCRLAQACLDCFRLFRVELPAPVAAPAKPRRRGPKRTYAEAVRDGSADRAAPGLREQQVRAHAEATARSRELAARVRDILAAAGVPARDFITYNSFCLRVDRHARRYADRVLGNAAAGCVDRWDARGARRDVLERILREVFGIVMQVPGPQAAGEPVDTG